MQPSHNTKTEQQLDKNYYMYTKTKLNLRKQKPDLGFLIYSQVWSRPILQPPGHAWD